MLLTIEEFKTLLNIEKIDVLPNPQNKGRLFAVATANMEGSIIPLRFGVSEKITNAAHTAITKQPTHVGIRLKDSGSIDNLNINNLPMALCIKGEGAQPIATF